MKDLYYAQKLLDLLDEAAGKAKEGWPQYYEDRKAYYEETGSLLEDWMWVADYKAGLQVRSKEEK